MRINEILRLVLINLKQNKFKVFLTSLGIIVGAATIVMVIAIGEGGKQDVTKQFSTLNAGTITVESSLDSGFNMGMIGGMGNMGGMTRPDMGNMGGNFGGNSGSMGGGTRPNMGNMGGGFKGESNNSTIKPTIDSKTLSQNELDNITYFVPNISSGAISASTDTDVLGGNLEEAKEYTIVGTNQSYMSISNLSLLIGSFITTIDEQNETRCVILGYDVAVAMFDTLYDAYDSKIEIDGRSYVVNGVLSQMGTVVSGINPDSSIFMPYSTADKYLLDITATPQFTILASNINAVDSVITNIELVLEQDIPDTTFKITDAGATMDAAMQSANTLSMLLMAIAIIVFIVGGIGIMNVLFVSVKERTREIGILKAIGTSKGDILLLFILEASIIGVFGGIVGVGVSFLFMPLLNYLNITAVMTFSSLVLAFIFATVTGTLFGVYPAYSASSLVPIDALNNE